MKRLFTASLALFIVLAFTCGPVLSLEKEKPGDPPWMKTKTGQTKEKIQSKDVEGKTEKNASQKTDKALGEGTTPPLPPIGPSVPVGKSTNTAK